jgi:hypothetical protein
VPCRCPLKEKKASPSTPHIPHPIPWILRRA